MAEVGELALVAEDDEEAEVESTELEAEVEAGIKAKQVRAKQGGS